MSQFPNTGSHMSEGRTNSGLSTQIIIKINDQAVGALQNLSVNQNRPLARVQEIGTDGTIEITPQGAATYELRATRVVFDQLRLPEAFSRGFRVIAAQRIPFDIEIYEIGSVNPASADPTSQNGTVVMTYKNCWFQSYETPYAADNYLITETATIWAETAFVSNMTLTTNSAIPNAGGNRGIKAETDAEGIEVSVNQGGRRGAMDASGVFNSILTTGNE